METHGNNKTKSLEMKKYNTVLTIAGSDSCGGAGVQADIKTITACGCYASSAITAVTVQNTLGVSAVHPVPTDIISGQIQAVLDDIGTDAVKIGMLNQSEVIKCVCKQLVKYDIRNVVLDPVMVSTSGHRLMQEDAIGIMVNDLIPLVRVITPNIPETEVLLGGQNLSSQDDLPEAARCLAERWKVSVLLKAGHLTEDKLTDIFFDYDTKELIELPSVRINTPNTHGTGCTMSSALASMLAKGNCPSEAVRKAKEFINNAIISGADYVIGHGHGPVNHLWNFGN